MSEVDKRDYLKGNPFGFRVSKDGKVFVSWEGKTVKTLRGAEAERLLARLEGMEPFAVQLALAKLTGNFKRGNER